MEFNAICFNQGSAANRQPVSSPLALTGRFDDVYIIGGVA